MIQLLKLNTHQNKRRIIINLVCICHIYGGYMKQPLRPGTIQNGRKIIINLLEKKLSLMLCLHVIST